MIADEFLAAVNGPSRYVGGEWNAVVKDPTTGLIRFALCYPDAYEVGMSHLGSRILYHVANARSDAWCERAFCPQPDALALMRARGVPLCALESGAPLAEMDIVGFTLQHELTYTTILAMLDLAAIPLLSCEREDGVPLVIAGGPCAYNPEPLADFIDAFVIGDGEDALGEICEVLAAAKVQGAPRAHRLTALAALSGVYVPALHDHQTVRIAKRAVADLDAAAFPLAPVVPYSEIIHDRLQVEVARGCTRGCRFCQAGMIYRPVRERALETLIDQTVAGIANTGWDEVSLISLSCADYTHIVELVDGVHDRLADQRVSVSLPSLRTDAFSVELARKVQRVKKSGLTFAPEAGTQALRDAINKQVELEDLLTAARAAFEAGWLTIKLYFMIGLPGETEEDVRGIATTAEEVVRLGREHLGNRAGRLRVNVSVASFVPKAHTPFQWARQASLQELADKQTLLRSLLRSKQVHLSCHEPERSLLEGVLARGDRSLGAVLLTAYRSGCVLDSWDERFNFARWEAAFAEHGRSLQDEATREWNEEERVPWQHIDAGVTPDFLRREAAAARAGTLTLDCREGGCVDCGVSELCGHCPLCATRALASAV